MGTTTVTNSTNKEVAVTTATKKDANGKVTGVIEKSEIKKAAEDTTVTVTVKKDADGQITRAASTVAQVVKSGNKASINGAVLEQIKEAAGTADVAVTVAVKDAEGNTKYKVKANAKDLVKGKKLAIYRVNTKTGEYEMVNAKTNKVNAEGTVNVSMTEKKVYELVTEAKSKELSKEIKTTVKAAKKKGTATIKAIVTLKNGEKKTVTMKVKVK